ncbi:MAG: hypothetical protein ACOVQZ_05710 [Candidatus Nanopelagicaceae bacterium]
MVKSRIAESDYGSIAPLIIFYFTILMVLVFIVSNVAAVYISRRELSNRLESSLLVAAKELDQMSYYYPNPLIERSRVPIDCVRAKYAFQRALERNRPDPHLKRSNRLISSSVLSFHCDGFKLSAEVEELNELPFQLRVFKIETFRNRIEAGVTSNYLR